jgi:hypothetical protein
VRQSTGVNVEDHGDTLCGVSSKKAPAFGLGSGDARGLDVRELVAAQLRRILAAFGRWFPPDTTLHFHRSALLSSKQR